MLRSVLLGLVLLALAGCGSDAGDTGGGGDAGALAGPVTYERSGGIGGMQEVLVIAEDGTATFTSRRLRAREFKVDAAKLDALVTALDGWQDVDEEQRFDGTISDAILSEITYEDHTVTTETQAEQDDRLKAVLSALGEIIPKG